MIDVTIYSKPQCPFCSKAKFLAESKGCNVKYLMLGEDFDTKTFMEEFPNARTFPQIVVSKTKIGGYVQLEEFFKNEQNIRGFLHGEV